MWSSWGRPYNIETPLKSFDQNGPIASEFLAIGNRRSYGDSCLITHGQGYDMLHHNHFLEFNPQTGLLKAQAGLLFSEILAVCVPKGWFLPVTPGTKWVTLGGAIANDIHGKNHHQVGTIGNFIPRFGLWRPDTGEITCSTTQETELFRATIGGLGLTGIITWAEIQLIPIQSAYLNVEWIQFSGIDAFLELTKDSQNYPYTVAWLDCSHKTKGNATARGVFIRGTHALTPPSLISHTKKSKTIPIDMPSKLLNPLTVSLFNTLYYHKQIVPKKQLLQHYDPFFYPLDHLNNWNKLYGKNGFYQYQCVIPFKDGKKHLQEMLNLIANSGFASSLSVLKTFGSIPSPGLLSFPQEGITLCLDFANRGDKTRALFTQLDAIVLAAKGRLYPAKDATMSPETFKTCYPNWKEFSRYKQPQITSDFWERVTS